MNLEALKDWWPVINSVSVAVIAILSVGWRQVGSRIDKLAASIETLVHAMNTSSTQIAVVQAQLQSHTEQDRASFHELRDDFGTRALEIGKRLDAQRSSIDALNMALVQTAVKERIG